MILIHPVRIASAMKQTCKPDGRDLDQVLEQLRMITSRVAGALNIDSFDRGTYLDLFHVGLYSQFSRPGLMRLRLANGFLTEGSEIVIEGVYGSDGEAPTPTIVDRKHGIITLHYAYTDSVAKVRYTSGFEIPPDTGPEDEVHENPMYRVGVDLPEELAGIVYDFYVNWIRNQVGGAAAAKIQENVSLAQLNDAISKDLRARIYNWYHRERNGMVFADTHEVAP